MTKIQILYTHISICPLSMSPFFSLNFSVSSSSLPFDSYRGVFLHPRRRNTSFSLDLLSLSFLFLLSFLCPLFSSFLPSLPFLSLSLSLSQQIFGAATATMPHRFRRAWIVIFFEKKDEVERYFMLVIYWWYQYYIMAKHVPLLYCIAQYFDWVNFLRFYCFHTVDQFCFILIFTYRHRF